MLTDDTRKEAVEACRQWAAVRERVLVAAQIGDLGHVSSEQAEAFDAQMFRLGEQVFTAEGEVTNVEPL